jgi:hypothetical protein
MSFFRLAEMHLIRVKSNFRTGLEEGVTQLKDSDTLREHADRIRWLI